MRWPENEDTALWYEYDKVRTFKALTKEQIVHSFARQVRPGTHPGLLEPNQVRLYLFLIYLEHRNTRSVVIPYVLGISSFDSIEEQNEAWKVHLSERVLHQFWRKRLFIGSREISVPSKFTHRQLIGFKPPMTDVESPILRQSIADPLGYLFIQYIVHIKLGAISVNEAVESLIQETRRHIATNKLPVLALSTDNLTSVHISYPLHNKVEEQRMRSILTVFFDVCVSHREAHFEGLNERVSITTFMKYFEALVPLRATKLNMSIFKLTGNRNRDSDQTPERLIFELVHMKAQLIVVPYTDGNNLRLDLWSITKSAEAVLHRTHEIGFLCKNMSLNQAEKKGLLLGFNPTGRLCSLTEATDHGIHMASEDYSTLGMFGHVIDDMGQDSYDEASPVTEFMNALLQFLVEKRHHSIEKILYLKGNLKDLTKLIKQDNSRADFCTVMSPPVLPGQVKSAHKYLVAASSDGLLLLSSLTHRNRPIACAIIPDGVEQIIGSDEGILVVRSGCRVYFIRVPSWDDTNLKSIDPDQVVYQSVYGAHFMGVTNRSRLKLCVTCYPSKSRPTDVFMVPVPDKGRIIQRVAIIGDTVVRLVDICGINKERGIIYLPGAVLSSNTSVNNDRIISASLSFPILMLNYQSNMIVAWDMAKRNQVFKYNPSYLPPAAHEDIIKIAMKLEDDICHGLGEVIDHQNTILCQTAINSIAGTPCISPGRTDSGDPSKCYLSKLLYATPHLVRDLSHSDHRLLCSMLDLLWDLSNYYRNMCQTTGMDTSTIADPESLADFPSIGPDAVTSGTTKSVNDGIWGSDRSWGVKEVDTDEEKRSRALIKSQRYLVMAMDIEQATGSFPYESYPLHMEAVLMALSQATQLARLFAEVAPMEEVEQLLEQLDEVTTIMQSTQDEDETCENLLGDKKWIHAKRNAKGVMVGLPGWAAVHHTGSPTEQFELFDADHRAAIMQRNMTTRRGDTTDLSVDQGAGFITWHKSVSKYHYFASM